ncbi:MAG TPA: hypothetical protein VE861_04055, partial [Gemmatimonadaceae bacterium]|nr:hypothetical protein [Gemmatimonadaceae bacterium]
AMSVTPVPFSIDPAGATPIDLHVPTGAAAMSAASAPAPQPMVATPEVATVAPVAAAPRKSAMSRGLVAAVAIAAVAGAGVVLTRNVTERENAAAEPPPTIAAAPIASAPVAAPPAVLPAPVAVDSVVDSVALKRVADSLRLVRKAKADSARARRDSLAASGAEVFSLPGTGGMTRADSVALRTAGRRAAEDCVAALNSRDMPRIESIFGGSPKNVVRIAKDGKLEVTGPLGTELAIEDANKVIATFRGTLRWTGGDAQGREVTANFRAISERQGDAMRTRRCLVDNDGGARF